MFIRKSGRRAPPRPTKIDLFVRMGCRTSNLKRQFWCHTEQANTYPWCSRNFVANGPTNKGILGVVIITWRKKNIYSVSWDCRTKVVAAQKSFNVGEFSFIALRAAGDLTLQKKTIVRSVSQNISKPRDIAGLSSTDQLSQYQILHLVSSKNLYSRF